MLSGSLMVGKGDVMLLAEGLGRARDHMECESNSELRSG